MLILDGDTDTTVPQSKTTEAVNKTCTAYPESEIEYIRVPGVGHVGVMYAVQTT
jgi:poly-beta-hydroxyalkanoate depolymerase